MSPLPQIETPASDRSRSQKATMKRPVFVLGSPRSGTTLLYHMLLSAGGFAVYRSEAKVFDLIAPRCGDLNRARNKQKILDLWFQTRMFSVSGVDPKQFEAAIMAECHNAGDFLRIFMEQIARSEGVDRWAECTPEHLVYLPWIKRQIPDALFIHIIRDGRDVALSLHKQGWVQPLPWDRDKGLMVAGAYWEWMVGKGRQFGRSLGLDYTEIRYEDLLSDPRPALEKLGRFIDHNLDYDRIQRVAIGSVSEPNTSFKDEFEEGGFRPVGRWRNSFLEEDLVEFESLLGPFLEELHYPLTIPGERCRNLPALKRMRVLHRLYWDSKLAIKVNTSLGSIFMKSAPSEL
jgi:LPS sulfotransferase NodH